MSFTAATQMQKLVDPYWESMIQETDEFSDSFWQRCQKLPAQTGNTLGRKVKVRTGYNESESWASFDGDAYAQGGYSSFQNLFVPYRTVSTQGLITKEAMDNDDGKSKYHPAVQEVAATIMTGMKKINRHALMGNGLATIAVSTAVETGSTITCAPTSGTFGYKGAQFVKPGKIVQIYDATGATLRAGGLTGEALLTVSSVNYSTGVITFTSAAPTDVVATDIVVPERSSARGMHGLPYWVASTGNLFELSRSTYPGLKSTMTDGSSGAILNLVETMFAQMAHYIEEDMALGIEGAGKHEAFWSPTQRQRYRTESFGLGILELGSSSLDAGYGHKEAINGYDFTCIKDHDNQKIHFLRMSDWYRVTRGDAEKPFEVIEFQGQKFFNKYDSSSREASGMGFILGGYVNLACKNVRNQAAIHTLPVAGLQTGNV